MPYQNTALWLPKRGARFEVSSAPYTPPGADQVVVRARALAVNPVDGLPGFAYRVVLPWLTFPAIVGSDVAGEVVEVGPGVTRLRPGDRVVGHALGIEKSQNSPAEGAFQHYVVLTQHMVSVIPESLSFEQAVWGSTLKDNEIGPAIYTDFLPAALTAGAYRAAPDAAVVGAGLARIPVALQQLRDGVSATKLVVTV